MAIAAPWVGTAVQGNVTGSNLLTVTVDVSGATDGEVCFIFGTLGDAQTGVLSTPAGWTKEGESSEGTSGGSSSRSVVYSKVKNSGDGNVVITGAGWTVATHPQFVAISWPGVNTTTPTEQFTWGAAHTTGTSYVSGTATPTAADRWAVGLFTARGTTAMVAWTPPAGMTERVDVINATGFFVALTVDDSNGAVTQASHSYTATGQSASHGLGALFYLIPATPAAGGPRYQTSQYGGFF